MTILDHLYHLRACTPAMDWVQDEKNRNHRITRQQLWDRCPNGAWMVWYLRRTKYPKNLSFSLLPASLEPDFLEWARARGGYWYSLETRDIDPDIVRRFFPQVPQ